MPPPRKRNAPRPQPTPRNTTPQSSTPDLIDPRWLLKALAIVLAVALLCAWSTLCLLWYQGQWQLVLHPSRAVSATPASFGLNFTDLRFAVDNTGTPQLDGWLIPAANPSAPTALMLHGADGSIADSLPLALTLHNAGLNILLFDYRGYGRSLGQRPNQSSMQQDTDSALTFLTATQHIAPQNIILYGQGIGASLAVRLAEQHQDIPAIILDRPDGDLSDRVIHDAHSALIPARLLFHETFPLAAPLRTLTTPKLLITYGRTAPARFADAADPKMTLELTSPNDPALSPAITRFLDQYAYHVAP